MLAKSNILWGDFDNEFVTAFRSDVTRHPFSAFCSLVTYCSHSFLLRVYTSCRRKDTKTYKDLCNGAKEAFQDSTSNHGEEAMLQAQQKSTPVCSWLEARRLFVSLFTHTEWLYRDVVSHCHCWKAKSEAACNVDVCVSPSRPNWIWGLEVDIQFVLYLLTHVD